MEARRANGEWALAHGMNAQMRYAQASTPYCIGRSAVTSASRSLPAVHVTRAHACTCIPQAPYTPQHKVSPTLRVLEAAAPDPVDGPQPLESDQDLPDGAAGGNGGATGANGGAAGGDGSAPGRGDEDALPHHQRSSRSLSSLLSKPTAARNPGPQPHGGLSSRAPEARRLLTTMVSFVSCGGPAGGGSSGGDGGGSEMRTQPRDRVLVADGAGSGSDTNAASAVPRLYELEVEVLPMLTAADLSRAEGAWPGLMAQGMWGGGGGTDGGSGLAAAKAAGCWPVVRAPRGHDGAVLGGSVAGGTYLLVALCEQVGGGMGVGVCCRCPCWEPLASGWEPLGAIWRPLGAIGFWLNM